MTSDIQIRIQREYDNGLNILDQLMNFQKQLNCSENLLRAILVLAEGDVQKFKSLLKSAENDWRDIILEAQEHYDLNKPFPSS